MNDDVKHAKISCFFTIKFPMRKFLLTVYVHGIFSIFSVRPYIMLSIVCYRVNKEREREKYVNKWEKITFSLLFIQLLCKCSILFCP